MKVLSNAEEGSDVIVESVGCGRELKRRLSELGIHVGSKLHILKNDVSGPVIVKVKDYRLMLGRKQCGEIHIK
ncbi:ferrous iron transport protein A [Nanoarchaeota archaeon]